MSKISESTTQFIARKNDAAIFGLARRSHRRTWGLRRHTRAGLIIGCWLASASARSFAGVLEDHVTTSSLWQNHDILVSNTVVEPITNSNFGISAFRGDGNQLDRVGLIFSYGEGFTPSAGDPSLFYWRFSFFESLSELVRDPLRQSPTSPSYVHEFAAPVNADWTEPIGAGSDGAFRLFYAEFDLRPLNIVTSLDLVQALAIVPGERSAAVDMFGIVAPSRGLAGAVGDEPDWVYLGAAGLQRLRDGVTSQNSLAYRVTSVPEPSAIFAAALVAIVAAASRR